MRIAVNGNDKSQSSDLVSSLDRGLLYGHTAFETIAVVNSKPRLLVQHLDRLSSAAASLSIPLNEDKLRTELDRFCTNIEQGCIRITISIGSGGRGYQSPEKPQALRILSEHAYPEYPTSYRASGVHLGVSEVRLAHQPLLAGIKHGNRIEQIIARQQWHGDWQEALLLDYSDRVIEATSANVFIVKDELIFTPELNQCGVEGVMRNHILELATELGFKTKLVSLSLDEVLTADEVFLSNSLIGIWPVARCQDRDFKNSPVAQTLLKRLILDEVIPHN